MIVDRLLCEDLIKRGKWTKDLCHFCRVKKKDKCSNKERIKNAAIL